MLQRGRKELGTTEQLNNNNHQRDGEMNFWEGLRGDLGFRPSLAINWSHKLDYGPFPNLVSQ